MADPGRIAGPVVIPSCVQVRLIWTLPSGKQVFNVLHGSVAGGFNATAAVAQAIYAAIIASGGWTSWKARVNLNGNLFGVDLRDLRTANMPIVQSTGGATAGTGATGATPPGSALVVTERTASAGRGFRGRVYLPGLDVSDLVAATGAASAATQTDALAFMNAVSAALTASGITLALANPARAAYTGRKGAAHAARAAAVVPITSMVVRTGTINSQRRRSQVA